MYWYVLEDFRQQQRTKSDTEWELQTTYCVELVLSACCVGSVLMHTAFSKVHNLSRSSIGIDLIGKGKK